MSKRAEYYDIPRVIKPLTAKKLRKAFGQLIDYHMDELREFIVDDVIRKDSDVREYVLSQIVTDDVLDYINRCMYMQPAIDFVYLKDEEDGDVDYDKAEELMHTIMNTALRPVCYDGSSDSHEWNLEDYYPEGLAKSLFKCPAICLSSQKIKGYRYEYDCHPLDTNDKYSCEVYDSVFLTAKGKWKFVRCNYIYFYNHHDDPCDFEADYVFAYYIKIDKPVYFKINELRHYIPVEYMGILFG